MFKVLQVTLSGATVGCEEYDAFGDALKAYRRGCEYLEGDAVLFGSAVEVALYNEDEDELFASSANPAIEEDHRLLGTWPKGGE